ncbi:hypothetical protein CEQ90_06415 [Lewinellaceae bacterium SD302]|nr:hypothetical protein CEQ90_06415 [Lewinellaceae bacterium SD302]
MKRHTTLTIVCLFILSGLFGQNSTNTIRLKSIGLTFGGNESYLHDDASAEEIENILLPVLAGQPFFDEYTIDDVSRLTQSRIGAKEFFRVGINTHWSLDKQDHIDFGFEAGIFSGQYQLGLSVRNDSSFASIRVTDNFLYVNPTLHFNFGKDRKWLTFYLGASMARTYRSRITGGEGYLDFCIYGFGCQIDVVPPFEDRFEAYTIIDNSRPNSWRTGFIAGIELPLVISNRLDLVPEAHFTFGKHSYKNGPSLTYGERSLGCSLRYKLQ